MADDLSPDPRMIRAFKDQARLKIMQRLSHRLASAPELAVELDMPQSRIDYHLKILLECECIEVAASRKRNETDTSFYTARPGLLPLGSSFDRLFERKPVTTGGIRALADKAGLALDAGAASEITKSTFAVETLMLTGPHQLTANQALRLTVANLRVLDEQSRQLNIATDAPLTSIELGVALFAPPRVDH